MTGRLRFNDVKGVLYRSILRHAAPSGNFLAHLGMRVPAHRANRPMGYRARWSASVRWCRSVGGAASSI